MTVLDESVAHEVNRHARWFGVYPALVKDISDPDGQGRVKVSLPWSPDDTGYEAWARLATMMAGSNRGTWFVPDTDDEVLVAFEGGDPRRPYVLGGLWNGSDSPPESMDGAGNQKLTLKDGPGTVTIEDSNGNSIKLESSGITVNAAAKVTVTAATAEISAATLTVNAGMSKFSGVVQAPTVIANSIVSSSYTPGAGNIW
jgi:uncharacterized protein involved in type VI secretion and phage assembly